MDFFWFSFEGKMRGLGGEWVGGIAFGRLRRGSSFLDPGAPALLRAGG